MGGLAVGVAVAGTQALVAKVSFFAKVKAELRKLFTNVPGWEASAAATMTYVAPLVETMVSLVEPEAAPAVNALVAKVQSALAAAAVVIKDAGSKPTLATYLNAVKADMAQVEAIAGVKDPVAAAKLAALVGTITGEVDAILTEVGSAA